jgi:hypothetical protein
MKTKNAEPEGKGENMRNKHKHVPDVIRVEYLRGYRDGLADARYDLDPYDCTNESIDEIDEQIAELERRSK